MSSRIQRNTRDFQGEGADQILNNQLALYKTPATIREIITAPFTVQITAPRRPLLGRGYFDFEDQVFKIYKASVTNKHYLHYAEPALQLFPFGYSQKNPGDCRDPANGGDPSTYLNQWPPMQLDGQLTTQNKILVNKQKSVFPYQDNVKGTITGSTSPQNDNAYALGDLFNGIGTYPVARPTPPSAGAIAYPGGDISLVNKVPNQAGKWYPLMARYEPPVPFPSTCEYYQGQYKCLVSDGEQVQVSYYDNEIPGNVNAQMKNSGLTDIFDLLGTEVNVDLQEQYNKLTGIQASSDKIMWELTLESVQTESDPRTLASSRLVNVGLESMTKFMSDKTEPGEKENWDLSGSNRQLILDKMYGDTGFGYPNAYIPRPSIPQPIAISFPEIACDAKDQPQFIANSNDGYSLDKGNGSIVKWGKWNMSQLKMNFGHWLEEPIGNLDAIENEVKKKGFYDLNNEWLSDANNGGIQQPVFTNQQINKLVVRFSIKCIHLF